MTRPRVRKLARGEQGVVVVNQHYYPIIDQRDDNAEL
jgi:hypothetical protein